jgi:hypothetical protein
MLRVAPDVMQFAQQALQHKKEYGGKLSIDIQNGLLHLGGGSWGKQDSVNIPHAIFEWHSHPNRCDEESDDCSLDMPSDTDIELICNDGIRGNHTHMVFGVMGTYVVALTPALRLKLYGLARKSKTAVNKEIKAIGKAFRQIQDKFEDDLQNGRTTLQRFRGRWLTFAAGQGLRAKFFPKGQVPYDTLVVSDVPV